MIDRPKNGKKERNQYKKTLKEREMGWGKDGGKNNDRYIDRLIENDMKRKRQRVGQEKII